MPTPADISPLRRQLAPRTVPFAHQWEALERGGNKYFFALLMDPGTGKTKIIIDNCAWLYTRGVINALLVTAPSDVPTQWVKEQFPLHWSRGALRTAIWHADSERAKRECRELSTKPTRGRFHVLAMNHEAFRTATGRACAKAFLRAHKCMFVLDESDAFMTPKALQTRGVRALAPLAVVRRIATGTPADRPFELYSQFAFLDERILGLDSFLAFKHHYGIFTKEFVRYVDKATGEKKLREYESLQMYQRLEELYARIDKYSYRKTKEECTDLPPKLYSLLPTHLTPTQRRLYDSIKEQGLALMRKAEAGEPVEIADLSLLGDAELLEALQGKGNRMTAALALVVMLRLQQCVGGFATDDAGVVHALCGADPLANPRIEAALLKAQSIVRAGGKFIIWAQFRAELEALYAAWQKLEPRWGAVLVHGGVTGAARTKAFDAFKLKSPSVSGLIAHPKTAGVGQNFQIAHSVLYYSDGYSYRVRKQSEDRVHRIGQTGTVNIYDLRAMDAPIEAHIASIRAQKQDLATHVMTWRSTDLEAQC